MKPKPKLCKSQDASTPAEMLMTLKAEYIVALDTSKEYVWIRKFIYGFSVLPINEVPTKMYCDNTEAITIANEPVITKDNNGVDPFTKALPFNKNSEHTKNIDGLHYFHAIPLDGIYEIDLHYANFNDSSIYVVSNKRAKLNLDSTLLWHCRLRHISKKQIERMKHDVSHASLNMLITQEESRIFEDLEIIQDGDKHPSENTSLHHDEDDQEINETQSDIIYHELGDLNKLANYRTALLDPEYEKWLAAMNVEMVDYEEETLFIVSRHLAIRILIAIAAFYDYEIWQMDVKTAFLNGHLFKEVYMVKPEGFVNP
ncbi:retrotransposon protein, putative, ty1-copia subclass [Tanacetum coccineum]